MDIEEDTNINKMAMNIQNTGALSMKRVRSIVNPDDEGPWIFTVDNIFVDVKIEFPDDQLLQEFGINPGS